MREERDETGDGERRQRVGVREEREGGGERREMKQEIGRGLERKGERGEK